MKRLPCSGPFFFLGVAWRDAVRSFVEREEELRSIGVRIVDTDLVYVHVPDGWSHEVWSILPNGSSIFLFDQKGRERARMLTNRIGPDSTMLVSCEAFTRFYDRVAISDPTRVEVRDRCRDLATGWSMGPSFTIPFECPPETRLVDGAKASCDMAHQWLDHVYPRWRDPAAYWDELP